MAPDFGVDLLAQKGGSWLFDLLLFISLEFDSMLFLADQKVQLYPPCLQSSLYKNPYVHFPRIRPSPYQIRDWTSK